MFTVFYTSVSTGEPTTQNEVTELQASGFLATMTFEEKAGAQALRAAQRPAFIELLRSIERITINEPKKLVVTKLERLGRDAEDVLTTVRTLHKLDVEVVVLQLGRDGLMSPNGKTILTTLMAVAELGRPAATARRPDGSPEPDPAGFARKAASSLFRAA